MNFDENDIFREKTELLYLRISKLARAKVLLKLEFDTEDQVLFLLFYRAADWFCYTPLAVILASH